jgi:hypothetical protein
MAAPATGRAARLAAIVFIGLIGVSCEDDGAPEAPADTVTGSDSVTTLPTETPTDGSTAVEPGTNQTPSSETPTSDQVPGPTGSGVVGTGETTEGTGG